jgi:hypothetical protein
MSAERADSVVSFSYHHFTGARIVMLNLKKAIYLLLPAWNRIAQRKLTAVSFSYHRLYS